MTTTYDDGFCDGLQWVADRLREAAAQVEKSKHSTFERKNGGGTFEGILKVGDVHFAAKLRDVATVIESAITESKGKTSP